MLLRFCQDKTCREVDERLRNQNKKKILKEKRREEEKTCGEVDESVTEGSHTVRVWKTAELLPPSHQIRSGGFDHV